MSSPSRPPAVRTFPAGSAEPLARTAYRCVCGTTVRRFHPGTRTPPGVYESLGTGPRITDGVRYAEHRCPATTAIGQP